MNFHSVAFLVATLLNVFAFIIATIRKFDSSLSEDGMTRAHCASTLLNIFGTLAWNVVQFLILLVFSKYGKPLQKDAKVLITKKLQSV